MNLIEILSLILIAATLFAADAEKPNPVIEKALAPTIAEAAKANEVYVQALAKATEKAIKELEKVKAAAMTKKDLDTANLADAKIKELGGGGLRAMLDAKDKEKGETADLLGEEKPVTLKAKFGMGDIVIVMTSKGAVCTFNKVDVPVEFTPNDAMLVVSGATKEYYDANGLAKSYGKMVAPKAHFEKQFALTFCEKGVIICPAKPDFGPIVALNYPKNIVIK